MKKKLKLAPSPCSFCRRRQPLGTMVYGYRVRICFDCIEVVWDVAFRVDNPSRKLKLR